MSSERYWMKEPCGPCPYSRSKTLWLHPERAADFAYNASSPYSDFPCHKTAEIHGDDEGGSEYVAGARSLTCNGFLSLQVSENGSAPEGFEPHPDAFGDHCEMIEHHEAHWEDAQERRRSARDSGRLPAGRRSEGAPCEASQSGGSEASASPKNHSQGN